MVFFVFVAVSSCSMLYLLKCCSIVWISFRHDREISNELEIKNDEEEEDEKEWNIIIKTFIILKIIIIIIICTHDDFNIKTILILKKKINIRIRINNEIRKKIETWRKRKKKKKKKSYLLQILLEWIIKIEKTKRNKTVCKFNILKQKQKTT